MQAAAAEGKGCLREGSSPQTWLLASARALAPTTRRRRPGIDDQDLDHTPSSYSFSSRFAATSVADPTEGCDGVWVVCCARGVPTGHFRPAACRRTSLEAFPRAGRRRARASREVAAYSKLQLLRCWDKLSEEWKSSTKRRLPLVCLADRVGRRCRSASRLQSHSPTWQVPLREQVPPRVVDSLTISVDKGKGLGARPSSAGPSKSKRFAGGGGQKALQRMPQRGVEKPTRQDDQWLVREVRSLLNKISPENESVIIQRFAALQIIGSEAFPIIASLILEKAVSEPFYSEVYARVLARLSLEFLAQEDLGLDQRRDARDKPSLWFAPASSQFEETCLEQCE
ncbi:unnamed protein product, partial [Polarella glacialis]